MATILSKGLKTVSRAGARFASVDAQAIRFQRFGHPTSVLKVENFKLDTKDVSANDVLVKMVAAPVTPLDLSQVSGSGAFPSSGPLPRVGGNEGLGVVEEAGASSGLKKGDVVVASAPSIGTWSSHVIAPGNSFTAVKGVDLKPNAVEPIAASVLPVITAKALLENFVQLKKGDTIIINDGASTVSQAVTQLAAANGIKVISLVKSTPAISADWAATSNHLQAIGATLVVSEDQALRHEFKATISAFPKAKLALNASGGDAATAIAYALAPKGTLVTYSTSPRTPAITAPVELFTNLELNMAGFNAQNYLASLAPEARNAAVATAVESVAKGDVKLLVARESFKDFSAALERTYSPSNARKVVLTF